ncbi:MAG: hypothetical protein KF770_23260 [Anaerolineae bacterium]|nr:hypothetical protein [Anaerolineae bacterium]
MKDTRSVTHDWQDESDEAKARWFQSLSLSERMDMFCWFTDMVLSANPGIVEQKDAEPIAGRILVLTKTQRPLRNHRRGGRDLARRTAGHV